MNTEAEWLPCATLQLLRDLFAGGDSMIGSRGLFDEEAMADQD